MYLLAQKIFRQERSSIVYGCKSVIWKVSFLFSWFKTIVLLNKHLKWSNNCLLVWHFDSLGLRYFSIAAVAKQEGLMGKNSFVFSCALLPAEIFHENTCCVYIHCFNFHLIFNPVFFITHCKIYSREKCC